MLLDANLLLYAVDSSSRFYTPAAAWLEETLNGDVAVGLPWQTIGAFVRIVTHPRIAAHPLGALEAWNHVERWLAASPVWVPPATAATARIFGELTARIGVTGNLVPDAQLAALALEHGVELLSADGDFARFPGLRWRNPLA